MRPGLLLLFVAGCAPPLVEGFEEDLTRRGGCDDVRFFAADGADTTMLSLYVPGLVAEAREADQITTTSFVLPDPGVDLVVEVGHDVSAGVCGGSTSGRFVADTWTATTGTATVSIAPGASVTSAAGTVSIDGVTFRRNAAEVVVDHFEIGDVPLGLGR